MEKSNNNSDNKANEIDKNKNITEISNSSNIINNDINDNKLNTNSTNINQVKNNIQNKKSDINKNNNLIQEKTDIKNEEINEKKTPEINDDNNHDSKNVFEYLFHIDINELWDFFSIPSFVSTYLYDNCKIINSINYGKNLKKKDIYELNNFDKNINIKIIIEDIIEKSNFKFISFKSIDVPVDMSQFKIDLSFYFCTIQQNTELVLKFINLEPKKENFIYKNYYENHEKIFKKIEQIIKENFKEYEQSESISINKNINKVWNFLVKDNYSNLKILLGNNATVKTTNIPNEIEIEHFTKKNILKIMVNKNIDFNEKCLLLQIISSSVPIPAQNIIIKIININDNSCLLFFTHKLKQFLESDSINAYSLIKQKTLWLLKSIIEDEINI